MPILRAQVTIPATSGIPADAVTNSWSFFTADADIAGAQTQIKSALTNFYEDWSSFRGLLQDWDSTVIKIYNMADPPKRAPIFSDLLGLTATAAASTLAGEVAVCMSFEATPVSGQLQARKRGRIYLGTLAAVAADSSTGRPNTTFLTAVKDAGQGMIDAHNAIDSLYTWVVHSHTIGAVPGTFDEEGISYSVYRGWVDNAWDTQRRRGMAPTNRLTFTTAP